MKIIQAVYCAKTCIISGIGHAINKDDALIHFVSSKHGITPTHCAEIICEHQQSSYDLSKYKIFFNNLKIEIVNDLNSKKKQLHYMV